MAEDAAPAILDEFQVSLLRLIAALNLVKEANPETWDTLRAVTTEAVAPEATPAFEMPEKEEVDSVEKQINELRTTEDAGRWAEEAIGDLLL